MNLKRLCLIAGLLGLPVAYANAVEITINVPVEATNVPAGNTTLNIDCHVGVGAPSTAVDGTWNPRDIIGMGTGEITVPSSRSVAATVSVVITKNPANALTLDAATHYKCLRLAGIGGQPEFRGANSVSGTIPR